MKKRRNIKRVKISIPNESILNLITSTPAFNTLSRIKLCVGDNFENVNHAQFADQMRLYPIAGAKVEEVKTPH